jgi:sugar fermentation stimulation protein A
MDVEIGRMRFEPTLLSGRLLRRYKRFLADITIESGHEMTIHCPNPGAMTGCDAPGSRIWYSTSTNSARKYRHSLELVETADSHWVGVNPTRANTVVGEALQAGKLQGIEGSIVRSESTIPGGAGRFDFRLRDGNGRDCYVEVKSVTLSRGHGLGAFPDAPSARARRHVTELQRVCESGRRALLIFCVQHTGVNRVTCADDVDPEYGVALRRASAAGVEVLAFAARVSPDSIVIGDTLPVIL